jgi:DNA-binding PadR family transcriptional regulator
MTLKLTSKRLKIFSGKEATLNHVVFLILLREPLISYDIWLSVKSTKTFRHTRYKTVCRRINTLHKQAWLKMSGSRPTKSSGNSPLYTLTLKAKAALKLSKQSIDDYLQTATEQQLTKFIKAFE